MNKESPTLSTSVDNKLAFWDSRKRSLFLIFKLSGDSGGSTPCVIDKFSPEALRLSWSLEPSGKARGELIISLRGAERRISDIDPRELVSGSNLIDSDDAFVLITLPTGDRYWLTVMSRLEDEDWTRLSMESLARAYGDDEPEYSLDLIKEANPAYEGR